VITRSKNIHDRFFQFLNEQDLIEVQQWIGNKYSPKKAFTSRGSRAHECRHYTEVDFADAVSVFNDNFAIIISDDHPDEERFIIIGLDFFRRILVIAYTYRDQNTIRIISARKANKIERQQYEA
jgi:uncharacterized DUF497 family protein